MNPQYITHVLEKCEFELFCSNCFISCPNEPIPGCSSFFWSITLPMPWPRRIKDQWLPTATACGFLGFVKSKVSINMSFSITQLHISTTQYLNMMKLFYVEKSSDLITNCSILFCAFFLRHDDQLFDLGDWATHLWNWSGFCTFPGLCFSVTRKHGLQNMCTSTESRGIINAEPLLPKEECCNNEETMGARSEGRFVNGFLQWLLLLSGSFRTLPLTEVITFSL